jgi:DNA polymerase-3 subunit alpha
MKKLNYPGSLHNHTDYSNIRLRDCINKLDDLFDYAGQLGHKVVALTDHESISGWVKAESAAKKLKDKYPELKVILGNEIYLCRNGLNAQNYNREIDRYYHFILLAKDAIGARQIREISTRAWMRSYMARGMRRVPTYYNDLFEIIGKNPGHVIGSTACLGGALPTQILRAQSNPALLPKIDIWIQQMDKLFGHGNFFFEMQPSKNQDQILVNKTLLKHSIYFDIPYIITTDSHYLRKEDRVVHKAYLNAQNGDREVDDFYATTYMMGTEELESYFSYFSSDIIQKAYENILKIRDSIEDYSLLRPLKIPNLKWKPIEKEPDAWGYEEMCMKIPMLWTFAESPYESDRYLVKAIVHGIDVHPDLQNQEAYDEINACLEDTWVSSNVNNARWSAYYLNLQNIIDICWEAGSLVGPGRGSGVGFILLYCLDITQINPLRETTKCFRWRFLNPERVSVLDVDFDIEGGRRAQVLNAFRKYYGDDRVANVSTFRTEKSKSAIATAARGLGIDVDIASYIASLVPADRGMLRTLAQCYYGDEENDFKPIKQFIIEMNNYPELWNVAQKIEGLICGSGIHAGGVIFVDEPFTNSTALMRAPDGTICTQFELHDCEAVSLIKYDALSVEAMDKIHNCLDLLCDAGLIERERTLKETYENVIGIYNIERDNPEMWKMVWNHEIQSLFQMEKQSGISGIATLKPTSVDDLAILNSTIRLMAQEKGGEMPTEKLARFKAHPNEWSREMEKYGLGADEQKVLEPVLGMSYGLCIAQEQFMELVQLPELGGFSLTWADKLRKSIAKKSPKDYEALTKEFFEVTKEKGIDQHFAHYVWDVLIAMSRGYGFNQSHTLAYSLIALQEMNLAFHYPIVFWNCACLINDAGGDEREEIEEEEIMPNEQNFEEIEDFSANDEEIDEDEDEDEDKETKKKKRTVSTNYGKIATAIGRMKMNGIKIEPPDINKSSFTFSPDMEENIIRYGMSGITRVTEDLVKVIIANRPYTSLQDFLNRVKVNKLQMVNLIKSGAFDSFGARVDVMREYIDSVSDTKKRITLQNMKMLIDFGLIPDEYDLVRRTYNFNKYLKKRKIGLNYYALDDIAFHFLETYFDVDKTEPDPMTESGFKIRQTTWDKIYQKQMDIIRPYIKEHNAELLRAVNDKLTSDVWNKYCLGNLSKWEMDSISFYAHDHELANADLSLYMIDDFFKLSESPEVERVIPIKGKQVPIFKLHRIAGTVLDRDKAKKTVSLLTLNGVVSVKIYGGVFEQYDKQISAVGPDGRKHVVERSMFTRGNKIIVTGIRQDDGFVAKVYSRTPWHRVEQIVGFDGDRLIIKTERAGGE